METYYIYILLAVATLIYAFVLNTTAGKAFADKYTWASVVIGDAIILIALWFLLPGSEWVKVVLAFVAAGVPMIGRSLINRGRKNS